MPQTIDAAHEFGGETRVASGGKRVAGAAKLALNSFQAELSKLQGAREIAGVALVMHRELFTGKNRFLRIGYEFVPEAGGAIAFATAFGHQRQFACGLRAELGGKTGVERKGAGGLGKVFFAFPVKELRETEKIERIGLREAVFARFEQGIDFAEESGEAAQVHLIVFDDSGEWLAGTATQIVEVKLRNEGRGDIVFAMPAEASDVEDMALEFDETDGAEAQSPKSAGGMQQVEMGGELRDPHGAGHGEATFEQRPIEGFAIEGDENWTLGDARREFMKKGIFFVEVAEEKLFDLQAAGVPPGEADEEGVGAGAAGEASGFGVEEKPFFGVAHGRVGAAGELFVTGTREELEGRRGRRHEFGGGEPVSNGKVFAVVICRDAAAEEQADGIGFVRETQRAGPLRRGASRL